MMYLKHPKMWLNAFLGKPNPIVIPQHQVTYQESQTPIATAPTQADSPPAAALETPSVGEPVPKRVEGDSVAHDMSVFKGIAEKLTSKVKEVAAPVVSKGMESSNQAASATAAFAKTDKFKKILPMVFFLLVLVVIGIVGFIVIKNLSKKADPEIVTGPTPTSAEYYPTEPSLYADDVEVLKLEETINQLDREIAGTQLRETTLNSPTLDFNVNFNAR